MRDLIAESIPRTHYTAPLHKNKKVRYTKYIRLLAATGGCLVGYSGGLFHFLQTGPPPSLMAEMTKHGCYFQWAKLIDFIGPVELD